jgi:hypothetical protein
LANKESKFKSFLSARKAEVEREPSVGDSETPEDDVPRKRGRPAGKRSDPKVVQVTAYIQQDTHTAVKIALLKEGKKRQFSDLVEELLKGWVEHAKT